ncbi:MAG: hypothetical protein PHX65_06365, partial [Sulfurimonas sp.]|nr:hypothetical protein [Sulfurimonas sp.]
AIVEIALAVIEVVQAAEIETAIELETKTTKKLEIFSNYPYNGAFGYYESASLISKISNLIPQLQNSSKLFNLI